MATSTDICKLLKWVRTRQFKNPPPLVFEGRLVSDQTERTEMLWGLSRGYEDYVFAGRETVIEETRGVEYIM